MLALFKKETYASANVVDGKLILSFPEALTPIVWQIDLNDAKSSAFEVIEDNAQYKLTSKKQGAQKKETIAPFATKDKAIEALMATSHALAHAHGQINQSTKQASNANNASAPVTYALPYEQKKSGGTKWIFTIIAVVLIAGLFMMANSMQPRSPSSVGGVSSQNEASRTNASSSAGVPVSADDFLRSR